MELRILRGEDFDRENYPGGVRAFLDDKIMGMDRVVYPPEYAGCIENMDARYRKNPRSFVCVMDGEKLAGYVNFFPVSEEMWQRITDPAADGPGAAVFEEKDGKLLEMIPDDDIGPADVPVFEPGKEYNLFILSVVIDEAYRDSEVSLRLSAAFIEALNDLKRDGIGISAIAGVTISEDGEKYARTRLFRIIRECRDAEPEESEENSRVYLCDGPYLKKYLRSDYYHKTFHDDVYLLLPFADHSENPRINRLYDHAPVTGSAGIPLIQNYLMEQLDYCRDYECRNEAASELRRYYLGEFLFLHTMDNYLDEEDPEEAPCIVGEEKVQISMLAHPQSHMYILMLFFENCAYSTSQLEDQCNHGYLKIRRPGWKSICTRSGGKETWKLSGEEYLSGLELTKGAYHYARLEDFLFESFGLIRCGQGKSLVCMDHLPRPQRGSLEDDPEDNPDVTEYDGKKMARELLNLLSGEAYLSMFQSFRIDCEGLRRMAADNLAIYDYYEAYMSEQAILFVYKNNILNRTDILDEDELFDENGEKLPDEVLQTKKRIKLAATYVFIMELVTFQNTALSKMTTKVSRALAQEGDVSYEYVSLLYQEFARTIKFWQSDNFRYYGTQKEAEQIRRAFANEELRDSYNEQQAFLEHIVELKVAQNDRRNGNIINIVAIILAVFQVRDYIVELLARFYGKIDVPAEAAGDTFNTAVFGFFILTLVIMYVLRGKNYYYRSRRLRGTESDERETETSEK